MVSEITSNLIYSGFEQTTKSSLRLTLTRFYKHPSVLPIDSVELLHWGKEIMPFQSAICCLTVILRCTVLKKHSCF